MFTNLRVGVPCCQILRITNLCANMNWVCPIANHYLCMLQPTNFQNDHKLLPSISRLPRICIQKAKWTYLIVQWSSSYRRWCHICWPISQKPVPMPISIVLSGSWIAAHELNNQLPALVCVQHRLFNTDNTGQLPHVSDAVAQHIHWQSLDMHCHSRRCSIRITPSYLIGCEGQFKIENWDNSLWKANGVTLCWEKCEAASQPPAMR